MKNLNFLKLFYLFICLMTTSVFVSCVDDNDDTEAPYLTVDPTTLIFSNDGQPASDSQSYFEISTNRHWTATVQDNKSWVTLSAYEGDGSAKVQVSIPAGINDEANIVIQISNKVGPLKSETVTIKSGEITPAVTIFNTNIGDQAVSSATGWPQVAAYDNWNASGTGAASVTYSGTSATIRNTGNSNSGSYNGASGPNVIFFGTAPSSFQINTITLTSAQTNLKLTFGASYSFRNDDGTYDNTFPLNKFEVSLSANGSTWTPITYTKNDGDSEHPYWILATADFTLKEAVGELYIKFAASESSVFRLDDITLATGNGGQSVELSGGTTPPSTEEPSAITIPELIAQMTSTSAVVDAYADRYFEAVVQNDVAGDNYSNNNLIVATENATAANNGLVLYGSQVDPTTLGVTKGDRLKITLLKGLATCQNRNGGYQVTGAAGDAWVTIEKLSGTATITPIVITPDQLAVYQNMAVTIQNATPSAAGIWANTSSISSHTFSANGSNFTVFCKKGATAFIDEPFVVTTGSITGLASVYNNSAQLVPRDLADVAAFSSSDPSVTGATPSSVSFTSDGGTKTVTIAVANKGSNTLSVSGLSGILSATVDNSTDIVTIVAEANTTDEAVSQTLTVTLSGYNSITVPVTVAATGSSNEATISLTNAEIATMTGTNYALFNFTNNFGNWTGKCAITTSGNNGAYLQINFNGSETAGAFNSRITIPTVNGIVKNIKVTTAQNTTTGKTLLILPADYQYANGSTNTQLKNAALAESPATTSAGGIIIFENISELNLSEFSLFSSYGAIYISSIEITYQEN